jgi:hypothetical protein
LIALLSVCIEAGFVAFIRITRKNNTKCCARRPWTPYESPCPRDGLTPLPSRRPQDALPLAALGRPPPRQPRDARNAPRDAPWTAPHWTPPGRLPPSGPSTPPSPWQPLDGPLDAPGRRINSSAGYRSVALRNYFCIYFARNGSPVD